MSLLIIFNIIKSASQTDKIECAMIFVVMAIAVVIVWLMCSPQWYSYIRLTNENVEFKSAFSQKKIISYRYYKNIYVAHYTHRGIFPFGYKVKFVVLSQVKMNELQLRNINMIKPSISTIIIKYNTKNLAFLKQNLPNYLWLKIQNKTDD